MKARNDRVGRLLRVIPLSLLLAIAALALFAWISEEVLDQDTQRFDLHVRTAVHEFASPGLTRFMRAITFCGAWQVLLPAGLLVFLLLMAAHKKSESVLLLAITASALALDGVLKLSFHRPRPQPFFGIGTPSTYSFPSGHALVSLCFYAVVAWIASRHTRRPLAKIIIWVSAVTLIGGIGFSRIYLGVHYPSDVIAGYAAGVVLLGTTGLLWQKQLARNSHRNTSW